MWLGLDFDATCCFPGEGAQPSQSDGVEGKGRNSAARGFLKVGAMNVISWNSFLIEFAAEDSKLRSGHVWAIQEHKRPDEHARALELLRY